MKKIFVILDKEFETFCLQLKEHFGRPLRLKRYIYYRNDSSGKSKMSDDFLQEDLGFHRSQVEGCLYIYT